MDIFELVRGDEKKPSRLFPCPAEGCDKSFGRRSDLVRHLRIHTNDRPHVCTEPGCGKRFVQRSALSVHRRTHTGERPHVCRWDGCGKAFGDSSSLARHRRMHTGARPYKCGSAYCGKSFCRRVTMVKHMRRSHPELPIPKPSLCVSQTTGSSTDLSVSPIPLFRRRPRRRSRRTSFTSSGRSEDDESYTSESDASSSTKRRRIGLGITLEPIIHPDGDFLHVPVPEYHDERQRDSSLPSPSDVSLSAGHLPSSSFGAVPHSNAVMRFEECEIVPGSPDQDSVSTPRRSSRPVATSPFDSDHSGVPHGQFQLQPYLTVESKCVQVFVPSVSVTSPSPCRYTFRPEPDLAYPTPYLSPVPSMRWRGIFPEPPLSPITLSTPHLPPSPAFGYSDASGYILASPTRHEFGLTLIPSPTRSEAIFSSPYADSFSPTAALFGRRHGGGMDHHRLPRASLQELHPPRSPETVVPTACMPPPAIHHQTFDLEAAWRRRFPS